MDLHFYSDLTDGTGQHGDPSFLDPQAFNGFDSVNKFPGGSDSYLTISGSGHPFLSSSETFHTPSLGDEEFEIPPISLDPDSALALSNVVSDHHGLGPAGHGGVVGGDDPSFSSAFVNAPPPQGLEHLGLGVMGQPGSTLGMDLGHTLGSQFSGSSPMAIDVPLSDMAHGLLGTGQLTTIDQSELSAHLGLGLGLGGGGGTMRGSRSPDHPLSATGSPTSSFQDDDMDDFRRSVLVESPVPLSVLSLDSSLSGSPLPTPSSSAAPGAAGRRGGGGGGGGGGGVGGGGAKKGRKKKDPNEPQKPVSAYALFFKDTQAAIKGQNPNATFGEVSKIVASMWDSLGEEQKQVYKRKNDIAKREYLKALAAYRANQMSQAPIEVLDPAPSPPPPAPPRPSRAQQYNPEENTITNICTSNIILDLPQVSTRSRTGAIRPPAPSPPPPPPPPPAVAKIVIKHTASGGVAIAAATAPRQPPPLQQMHGHAPPPPRLVHGHAPPPPLQAKPRAATAPPPLQIKAAPSSNSSSLQADAGACPPLLVSSAGAADAPASPAPSPVVLEEGADVEEGMEVEVTVAPGPAVTPDPGPSQCVRAGCTNPAVESQDWDREYCSNECVATHCRDVFMAWCAIRGQNSTTVS